MFDGFLVGNGVLDLALGGVVGNADGLWVRIAEGAILGFALGRALGVLTGWRVCGFFGATLGRIVCTGLA